MDETLTRLRIENGVYEGILRAAEPDDIEAVHNGKVIAVATPEVDSGAGNGGALSGQHNVRVSLPSSVLSDGVQVIALRLAGSGTVLDRITLMAGSALDEDLRAEIGLLRDELELLKQAFRRHVNDSDPG